MISADYNKGEMKLKWRAACVCGEAAPIAGHKGPSNWPNCRPGGRSVWRSVWQSVGAVGGPTRGDEGPSVGASWGGSSDSANGTIRPIIVFRLGPQTSRWSFAMPSRIETRRLSDVGSPLSWWSSWRPPWPSSPSTSKKLAGRKN